MNATYAKDEYEMSTLVFSNDIVENIYKKKLIVREIFYSLQGEGSRAGESSIFIRLAFCNQNCWFCDTDWSFGEKMTLEEIENNIKQYECNWIVFTGGEPTLQLTDEIVDYFKELGYNIAIETNGSNPVPKNIDYISCSPKVNLKKLHESFPNGLDEIRYVMDTKTNIPDIEDLPKAVYYYVSPIFLGKEKERYEFNRDNLEFCIEFIKKNINWRLSTQQHKFWNIK